METSDPGIRFTPQVDPDVVWDGDRLDDGRIVQFVNGDDFVALARRERDEWVVYTDQRTGARWRATRIPCGGRCHCAAYAKPEGGASDG